MTDPIADFLTRIRNAQMARNAEASAPYSKLKESIARVMKKNNFIADFRVEKEGDHAQLVLRLPDKKLSLERISRPGQRIYTPHNRLYKVLNGFGISIVSTSRGVMTGYEAQSLGIGGEVLCEIS